MKNKLEQADIEATVVGEDYHVFPGTTVTVCLLKLRNGYSVTGESACVDPKNFNLQVGQEWARKDAMNKIWRLEGYLLKDQMHKHAVADAEVASMRARGIGNI